MTSLDELRAELAVSEVALSDVPEDASAKVKSTAKAKVAAAQKALGDAHVEAEAREKAKVKLETRPVSRPAVEQRPETETPEQRKTLQEFIQEGSTQGVRGTQDLSPEQHAARRNPKST